MGRQLRKNRPPRRFVQHRDPWREAAAAVRRSDCSPAAKLLSDAIEDEHRQNPRFQRIWKGHGGRLEFKDQHGHIHHCRPGWAEAVGMSRRSMIRARFELEESGIWSVRPGGGRQINGMHRGGNGGRKPGGDGLANEWCPAFAATADPDERPEDDPDQPRDDRKPLREYWDEHRRSRSP